MEQFKNVSELGTAASSVYQFLVQAFGPDSELRKSISRLDGALTVASQLIERSECWCFRYDSIGKLLSHLKNAVYEAELIIEEFNSQKRRAENTDSKVTGVLKNNFNNWATGFKEKVKSAQNDLDSFCDQLEKICNSYQIPQNPQKFNRPITVSRPPDVLYGRDKELDDAFSKLGYPRTSLYAGKSSSSTEKKRKISVLPIVGIGGVGKTTLSQMVYKDKRVQSYYDLKIWTCVAEKFDLERMLKEIIQCATRQVCKFTNLDLLQDTLVEAVKSKRVLLVLDDIWSAEWQQLLGPMNEASEGSAIILTTRSRENFNCTEGNMNLLEPILLEGLEEKVYWEFFKRCAGLKVDSANYSELEPIASTICSRLEGLPLAAKTVGGVLSQRIDRQHWITIRDSEMWKVKQGEDGIMHVLLLSYLHLPSELKRCFSYCSVFPKDHKFYPLSLARFWIMNRLIPEQKTLKSMQDLAFSYFYELENRGFFHSSNTGCGVYVMHDLMHDVCQYLKEGECYCLIEAFANIPPNVHHMSVSDTKLLNAENLRKLLKLEKLHTLLVKKNWGNSEFPIAFKSLCDKLTSIRRLSLGSCYLKEIPENIGNLKHLQYLDISDNRKLNKLPQSLCNLYDLEYLDMRCCDNFCAQGFPSGCEKLRGLKYFIPPVHLLSSFTRFPNLYGAIQLWDFIYELENRGRNKIEILKHLTGLGGFLYIEGLENVSSKKAAEEAGLNKQEHLDKLRLSWGDVLPHPLPNNEIHKEVLEGLCPHSNLQALEIFNYGGSDLPPSWMGKDDLRKLRSVMFYRCWSKTVSQLPRSLTELKIQYCYLLESLANCLHPNLLPNLKCIEIRSCDNLKSLPLESICEFKYLEKLTIKGCQRLTCPTEISLPPSLKLLDLNNCGELENSIPNCLQNHTSLEVLSISLCPNIISIPNEVMRSLPSLRRLDVYGCPNLESLGDEEFLQSIDFTIDGCPNRQITWGRNPNGRQLSAGSPQVPASLSPGVQTRAQTRRLSGQGVVIGGVRGEYRVEEGSGKGKEKVVGKKAEEFSNLEIAAKESRAQRFNEQNQVSGRGLSSQQPISNTDNTGALGAAGPSSSGTTMLIDQTPMTGLPLTPGSSVTPSSLQRSSTATIDALPAAAPSSSNTISEMTLIDQTPTTAQGATASAASSAPPINPSLVQSIETPTTDDPSSFNPRKRKAGAQN
ncbi:hypothetical protein LUZ61_009064 [Rhynchospora tenuis]|uniref:NB-ARC domain-containing protein n=1 Tax=Rhynchospora tenuis TaxID=198213 RepID=A0AAD5ZWU7_9POAL|nr:hypothetical protein LUZ61_009064 [Rhynchospora tenuis]